MELEIEKWLNEQDVDNESLKLFEESIICYKAGAYRAGFLFSYLGAQSVLKDRLLRGDRPGSVREHFWDQTIANLRDDNTWENTVWTTLESAIHGSIFGLRDGHLKTQLQYWKGIRNDCAHAKDNEILAAHIESYWAFLRSNLPKLVVSGGKDSIINRIKRYFDRKYTPLNTNPSPIIRDLVVGVRDDELDEVFKELVEQTKDTFEYFLSLTGENESAFFWKEIIEVNDRTSSKCMEYLINHSQDVLYFIIDCYPSLTTYITVDHEFVRNLWYEKISEFSRPLEVLASLLDNNCIPQEQTEEAISRVIINSKDTVMEPLTLQRLNHYGFSIILKKEVFKDHDGRINVFSWANSHKSMISSFLLHHELDLDIVTCLSDAFQTSTHPFELRDSLLQLFNENQKIKNLFTEIAEQGDISLPERLGF